MLGQDGRTDTGWVVGIAVLLAGVLAGAVGVAALRTDTASADTVLIRGDGAVLQLADGTRRDAAEGERVPRGATVQAGRTGAVLQTRDREVHLGADTAVTVVDGARQALRTGFVMVDASDAPGLALTTSAGTVTTADDSLVRVDGGSLVRAGVLRGDAASVRAADRRATADVPTYFQVQVPAGGLPGEATPFVLTPGDAYERRLAAALVRADDDLNALGSRLESDDAVGRAVLTALRTSLLSGTPDVAPAAPSERSLGYLVAAASAGSPPIGERYERVLALREAGGSWGVVAAIVSAEVADVGAALSALLEPGAVPVVASEPFDVRAVLDPAGSAGGPAPAPGPPPPSTSEPASPPGGGPAPTPSPTAGPTDPVVDPVKEVVDEVVDTVLDLVSPSPSPTSSPTSSPEPLLDTTVLPPLPTLPGISSLPTPTPLGTPALLS